MCCGCWRPSRGGMLHRTLRLPNRCTGVWENEARWERFISGLARPDVNLMLQMRAQLRIVGGGMLAVFSLGLLLLRRGLF